MFVGMYNTLPWPIAFITGAVVVLSVTPVSAESEYWERVAKLDVSPAKVPDAPVTMAVPPAVTQATSVATSLCDWLLISCLLKQKKMVYLGKRD